MVLTHLVYLSLLASLCTAQGSTTCDADCQARVETAITFERAAHAHVPLDDFYSLPSTFDARISKPGDLLKVEQHTDLTNYTVPSSLTMSRIIYASQNLNGTTVPATAFVLWPYAPYDYSNSIHNASSFPVIAWSHGTSGLFPACAPSNYRSLQYHFMAAYSFALDGFTVVATDYAGLGVQAPGQAFEYQNGPSGANDVAYAIEAARKAFPKQLKSDGPFIATGHSEGGQVAYAFAERQAHTPVPGYLGTTVISGPSDNIAIYDRAYEVATTLPKGSSLPPWVGLSLSTVPLLVAAVTAVYPSYNYSGFPPIISDRWFNVLAPLQGCLPTATEALADIPVTQWAVPGWTNNSFVKEWQDRTVLGKKPLKGPLLFALGDMDALPVDSAQASLENSCRLSPGESIELQVYQNMMHFPVIQASHMERMQWIKDRFDGTPALDSAQCGKKKVLFGVNQKYTTQGFGPQWLVDWTNKSWELSL